STPADIAYGSQLPVFPGGYLIGGFLVINLIASHFYRFKWSRKKAGILMGHFGLITLLLRQLITDKLSTQSTLHLRNGESKNYSESDLISELTVVDTTDADADTVVAIPQRVLMRYKEIRMPELPFMLRVKNFFVNSDVQKRAPDSKTPV